MNCQEYDIIYYTKSERRGLMESENYTRPDPLLYRTAQLVAFLFATGVFKRKMLRNEIKDAEGPYVVIANHEAAYDFANLIGATRRRMTFVISNSFYNSLPITGVLKKLGVIPKQQFQTTIGDMRRIKSVIENGEPLVIYPAGLMCEDGISTPIPQATYKFLKWLDADVYVARASGTYFTMPKWTKGFRPGRTYMDIYKLFDRAELRKLSVKQIKEKTDEAILFDAYREQEKLLAKYSNNANIEGLENVLYACPNCGREFTVKVKSANTVYCTECGFAEESDEYGFLHNKGVGEEIRYVSDWSRLIYNRHLETLRNDPDYSISAKTRIYMLDYDKHKFTWVGLGTLSLGKDSFRLSGRINGESVDLTIPSGKIPTLPFKPGKYLEVQRGGDIYRCELDDGKLVMKFINTLKAFFELNN